MAEKSIIQVVVEGAEKSVKQLNSVASASEKLSKTSQQAGKTGFDSLSKSADSLSKRMSGAQKGIQKTLKSVDDLVPGVGRLTSGFNGAHSITGKFITVLEGIPPPVLAAAAAIAALTVGLKVLYNLGSKGAALQQQAQAFGNLVSEAGDANDVLASLRTTTRGNFSDFELMRNTTNALLGTSNDFRMMLLRVGDDGSTALGRIIDGTGRLAIALGRDQTQATDQFLQALKTRRKQQLQQLGIIFDTTEAERTYAESIGKTAAQLTEEEKNAAFAAAAIRGLDESVASLGDRSDILDQIGAPARALKNILDKLALAAVPAFAPIAKLMGDFGDAMENVASVAFPIIARLSELIGNILTAAFNIAGFVIRNSFIGQGLRLIAPVVIYTVAAITLLLDAINALFTPFETLQTIFSETGAASSGFAMTLQSVRNIVSSAIGGIGQAISGLLAPVVSTFNAVRSFVAGAMTSTLAYINNTIMQMIFSMGQGGGAITGAFATGLLNGGTKVVEAVTAIAQIVADFLQGFSPPKVGPLSRIDEGGFNIAKTWAEGFRAGFVRPMQTVRNEITSVLGEIGDLIADDLETRLRGLDIAILPFNEQLQLAKARVEELAGFVDPALRNVERQRKAALEAFARGETDAEAVRALDRQSSRLKEIKSTGEALADQAETELAFAKGLQAVERAKLEIQQNRIKLYSKEAVAAEAVQTAIAGGGGGAGASAKAKSDADKAAKAAAAKAAKGGGAGAAALAEDVGAGLTSGQAPDLLANAAVDNARQGIIKFASNLAGVGGDVIGKIGEAGGQFGQGFATGFAQSGFDEALGDFQGSTGELQAQIARIAKSNPVQSITEKFTGLADILTDPLTSITDSIGSVFGAEGTIFQAVNGLFSGEGLFGPEGLIASSFRTLFGEESPLIAALAPDGLLLSTFTTFKDAAITVATQFQDGILRQFNLLVTQMSRKFDIMSALVTTVFTSPLSAFNLARIGVGVIFNAIQGIIATFASTGVGSALAGLAGRLYRDLEAPIISTLNSIIGAFEAAINAVLGSLPGFVRDLANVPSSIHVPRIGGAAGGGQAAIQYAQPIGPVQPNARGGLGVSGLALVGERGPELINLRRPGDVFPAGATRNILDFMAAAISPMGPGQINNSTVNNNQQRTVNAQFNGMGTKDSVLILRELEALP